jgi:hypothetical protein
MTVNLLDAAVAASSPPPTSEYGQN